MSLLLCLLCLSCLSYSSYSSLCRYHHLQRRHGKIANPWKKRGPIPKEASSPPDVLHTWRSRIARLTVRLLRGPIGIFRPRPVRFACRLPD
ncbi:hypothetical protein BJX64DRAFT_258719 [Aspergillus heterothallicus]